MVSLIRGKHLSGVTGFCRSAQMGNPHTRTSTAGRPPGASIIVRLLARRFDQCNPFLVASQSVVSFRRWRDRVRRPIGARRQSCRAHRAEQARPAEPIGQRSSGATRLQPGNGCRRQQNSRLAEPWSGGGTSYRARGNRVDIGRALETFNCTLTYSLGGPGQRH